MSDQASSDKNQDNKKQDVSAQNNDAQDNIRSEGLADYPLQTDRLAQRFPRLEALQILAGHYGRRTSLNALTAGLPISKEGVSPALFIRAAKRADLNAQLVERTLEALVTLPIFPCIALLKGGQACIIWDAKPHEEDEYHLTVQFPEEAGEKAKVTLAELQRSYNGYAFFVRPVAHIDDRAGPATIDNSRDWFWQSLKDNKKIYIESGIAAIMINMFALANSLFIMNVYDRVVPNGEQSYPTLVVLAVGVFIVFIFDFILKNLRAHFLDYAGKKADVKISSSLFEQILGMQLHARPASAGVLASNMREFETIRDFFTSATMATLIDLPFALFFVLIIFVIGGPVAFVPLIAMPLVLLGGWILQKPLERIIKESMHENALKNALLFETITGLETIKTQAAEGHTQRRWEELTEKAARTSVKSRRVAIFAQNYSLFVQQVASIAVVIVGVFMINAGLLSMGALIACVILSGRAMAPLAQVSGLLTRFNQSREAFKQLDDLMKKPVERPSDKHFITMPHMEGDVFYSDVVFRYPSQTRPALEGINFRIPKGERVGIIGAVGSGKTTLERLLLNLYQPESGSIQIDGTDVRQIDPGDLRRNVGSVQQSPQLFFGTVRENITMGHETAPDSAVLRAAELSGVMEFLRDSEAGLDTQVGERGEALSGGQRQAIAIARALLYDPPILILDEPTASMDPASENRLRKRLESITEGRTTILITHKGAMLTLVDKLILIDRGKLVAYGPKDDVIAKLQARQYGSQAENTDV
ncbi:MAG: type I secretion system permease/ATPase [Pseudomonadota bacterium]|nr:type I secretion system permease/ATPase [Pseudomonadota bacterium]MEC9235887.1 type I secretion system permease/ATPase [Pseudomonadota bacterium]